MPYSDLLLSNDNPYRGTVAPMLVNVQLNYEKMRRIALAEGYAKVFVVESDMIVPEDALVKLLEIDAPIMSGLYVMRHGDPQPNIMGGIGTSVSWEFIKKHWGETVECAGGCMGCLLIDTSVLKDFSFEIEGWRIAPDGPFMRHCVERGIRQKARLDVVCGHKKPDGEILWPQDFIN